LAPKGLSHYWRTHYADKKFEHLYRLSGFDLALLIPYFIVMIILAFYGIHRYQLVWLYYRNKKKAATWRDSVARFAEGELPFVTIQLPIFNEQFVIERLIQACCRIEYPRDRFEIQVLDDSTDETIAVARDIVERYAAGFAGMAPQPVYYLHRENRYGYKAGALD
jgi:cellulose synthase/poly-beta-1,6-N-acetylglucosamine synthase-like glycosyltransferase